MGTVSRKHADNLHYIHQELPGVWLEQLMALDFRNTETAPRESPKSRIESGSRASPRMSE